MRNKIINKSGELFLTLGFKSVTMDDIANEMGISKKTPFAAQAKKFGRILKEMVDKGEVQRIIDKYSK